MTFRAKTFPGRVNGKPGTFPKCSVCQKIAYDTEESATEAGIQIGQEEGHLLGAYYKPSCGWWHLTRQTERAAKNREIFGGKVQLRDYQDAAVDHLFGYFYENTGNPIVALPTGTGKSIIIADFIKKACQRYPKTRVMMLTHVKELIDQNMKALLKVWPTAPAGVYSAGLKRREAHANITFAGIQSVRKKAEEFGFVDMVLIDECHLVSDKDTTSYQTFLRDLTVVNPQLKVIGFTATAYRLAKGMLTDEGGLFTDLAFDLTSREAFNWLVRQGWLSPLIPKQTISELNVEGVRLSGGEYKQRELQDAVDREAITHAALLEARELAHNRKHWLVFATGVEHAEHICDMLNNMEITAGVVHSKMPDEQRDKTIRDFRAGRLQAVVNNNVLTTGFDYPDIDCIVMLRPTASPGLWVQMLGRGTRPVFASEYDLTTKEGRLAAIAAGPKQNCLVLDFAGNTRRLGPINDPVLPRRKGKGAPGVAPVRLCEQCGCYSHASCRFCENPQCGVEFPKAIKIMSYAATAELIVGDAPVIEDFKVDHVLYAIHKKEGKPDSMKVTYQCGLRQFKEYVTLDHGGYAARVALRWWRERCPWGAPPNTHEGMKAINYLRTPTKISVVVSNKYPEICGYTFA